MKILVTGSAGFIGYNLCKRLLDEGNKVVGIDSYSPDYDINLKELRTKELISNKSFEFIKLDINNVAFNTLLNGSKVDYVIHLAAKDLYYGSSEFIDYSPFIETNVLGTSKAFDLSRRLTAKKFIFISTHSIYGNSKRSILTEKKLLPKPISPHGASKFSAEHVVQFMSNFYKIPSIILRVFSVYGPGMRPHTFIPLVIDRLSKNLPLDAYADYNVKRDFIYIDDVVSYILATLNKRIKFQVINIASGKSYMLKEIVIKIAEIMKKDPNRLEFKRHERDFSRMVGIDNIASVTRAKKILKYSPLTDIDLGLAKTVEWYLKNPGILEISTHH